MAPANRLQALFELSSALSSTLELDEVLELFSARAAELTGATAAELSLLHPDGDTIVMLTDWSGNWAVSLNEPYSEAGGVYSIRRFETMPAAALTAELQSWITSLQPGRRMTQEGINQSAARGVIQEALTKLNSSPRADVLAGLKVSERRLASSKPAL